ncbi:HNH endonuclease [Streptococcus cristatus]|uniref:HNH endonuclease n=1 Tax=Streptococcus cristatus TaxID=45634 RepID=UPI000661818F|nr:hypothetical protein [Streptococcus cristatus]
MIPIKKSNSKQVYEFCRDIYEKLPEKDELDMLIFKNFGSHNGLENYFTQQDRAFLKLMMADYSTLLKVKEKIDSLSDVKLSFEIRVDRFNDLVNQIYHYLDNTFIEKCNGEIEALKIGDISGVTTGINLKKILLYKNDDNLKKIRKNRKLTGDLLILVNRIRDTKEFIKLIKNNLEYEFLEALKESFPDKVDIFIEMIISQKSFNDLAKNHIFDGIYTIKLNKSLCNYAIEKYKEKLEYRYNQINKKALVRITGITVCPYCNRNFINVTEEANTSQLDHFFPKNEYPLFALCFYNLIPSCYGCNNKKSTSKFYISPYDESITDIDELLKFSLNIKSADFINNSASIDIIIKDDISEEELKQLESKDDKSESKDKLSVRQKLLKDKYVIDTRSLYKLHADIVQELLWKHEIYNKDYKSGLCEIFSESGKSISDSEIDRMIVGYYTDKENYGKRPLSKMVTDISKEIGLIGEKE